MGQKIPFFESKFDLLNVSIFCRVKQPFLGLKIVILVQTSFPELKKFSILGLKAPISGVLDNKDFGLGQKLFLLGAGNAVWRHKEMDLGPIMAIFGQKVTFKEKKRNMGLKEAVLRVN